MPTGTILFEGHNLTLGAGTGIATYARVLAETARRLGYGAQVLVGSSHRLDRNDALLSEVSFYDVQRLPTLAERARLELYRLAGAPFGVTPVAVPQTGAVVEQGSNPLGEFERVYALARLLDIERLHFKRHRKPLRVKLDEPPALFHATRPAPLEVPRCPNLYTIHDLVPLRLPYTTPDDKKYHLNMIRELCRRADHIVTVSEFSRRDIMRLTGIEGSRITNTYQSVHIPQRLRDWSEAEISIELERCFELGFKDYFLFVGAIEPKKNLSRLIDAFASSGVHRPLVVAGGLGWLYESDLAKLESERFLSYTVTGHVIRPQRQLRRLSYLPFSQLISLMRGARALLFPSIYEGFGLPMLEAMALGTAVMTSNVSSLPEIAGDAALLVDPYDVDGMAVAIRTLDEDSSLREELAAKGLTRAADFSPERYAERIQELYSRFIR